MTMRLDHTIVWSTAPTTSAEFLADVLRRPAPVRSGPFVIVELDDGVRLDFMAAQGQIQAQHYAFLISEAEFDAVLDRIKARGLPYWADPYHRLPNTINRNDGGRGVYFSDPDGHDLEVITRTYSDSGN